MSLRQKISSRMLFSMAVWRRKATALFPELRSESRAWTTSYQCFFDLLPLAFQAHKNRDDDLLRRIYGFAEWCLRSKSKDLWNSAGVCFYESLFDKRSLQAEVLPWLSPYVVKNCITLWSERAGVVDLLKPKGSPSTAIGTKKNCYQTGEIKGL